jgi:putative salt-induced outer membrane protein
MPVAAQDKPKEPDWTGGLGAGLSLTTGNTDTQSFNLAFDLKYDPKSNLVFKTGAMYLRSEKDGTVDVERISAMARLEYKFSPRFYAFGDLGYQRDRFKELTYLVAPTAGVGYKVVDEKTVTLAFDGGAGGRFEKLTHSDATSNFAFVASENFQWKISETATFKQLASGLWNGDDTGNAVYHLEFSLSAQIYKKAELKIAYLIDHRTRPANPSLEKTDTALVVALVWKF